MNLAELLTAAISRTAPLPATAAAQIYAAVAEDRTAYSLYLVKDIGAMPVETETGDGFAEVTVGPLRYLVATDGGDDFQRLCLSPGCENERLGRRALTVFCDEHLDSIIPGMLPAAGDDILPGDRERAARESRARRLAAWEDEILASEQEAAGDRRVLAKLREAN